MKLGCWHMKAIADGHLNNILSNVKALVGPFNNEQREGPSRNFPKIVKVQTSQRFVSSCSALAAPVSQHLSWLQRGSEMIRSLGPATSLSSQPVSSVTTPVLVTSQVPVTQNARYVKQFGWPSHCCLILQIFLQFVHFFVKSLFKILNTCWSS